MTESMATFSISQTPDDIDLYLYPSGDVISGQTPHGETHNYECIDEPWYSSDADTSYVSTASISAVSDWYSLPDHTDETGRINYVRVVAQARSSQYNQSIDGIYRVLIGDGSSTASSQNNAPLTTGYRNYTGVWTTRPSGGDWTWTDIDNLQIGVLCSSPVIGTTTHLSVFRPDGNGDSTTLTGDYTDVDEEEPDDGDYLQQNGAQGSRQLELCTIPEHTTQTGSITQITVYTRDYGAVGVDMGSQAVKTGGTVYYSAEFYLGTTWGYHSKTWTTNPDTSSPWTWDDIDSLQIGVRLYRGGPSVYPRTSQLYLTVQHEESDLRPMIRTTQCYAAVNYTPSTTTINLELPDGLTANHARTIRRTTFPDGLSSVDDYGRSNKSLTLTGLSITDAESNMATLRQMMHYGKHITIDGLPDASLNQDYMITGFTCSQQPGMTGRYRWTLDLEET